MGGVDVFITDDVETFGLEILLREFVLLIVAVLGPGGPGGAALPREDIGLTNPVLPPDCVLLIMGC